MFRLKRAYEDRSPADGHRVLVERLWPRGVTKAKAAVDRWLKEVAPSDELRKWFGHDPAKWSQFQERYWKELEAQPRKEAVEWLRQLDRDGTVTLVYAARDTERNGAVALKAFLERRTQTGRSAKRASPRHAAAPRSASTKGGRS